MFSAHQLIAIVCTLLVAASSGIAQDCDGNGIPDVAEIGPFGGGVGGSLWLTGVAENAVTPVTPWSFANNSFTIEMWVYRDDVSGNQQYLLSTGEPGTTNGALFVGFRDDDRFVFGFWGNDLETVDAFPPDGQWHHWVCRYDSTTNFRWILRDGVEVAFDVSPTDYLGPAAELYLGGLENTLNFSGALDEVRIFASARSDVDIAADRFMQYDESGLPFGLHAYYPLDETDLGGDLAASNDAVLPPGSNQYIGSEIDCDGNGIVDACDPDCNANGVPDVCDIALGLEEDCDGNGVPDHCDIAAGTHTDTNSNGLPDECERRVNITQGTVHGSIRLAIENADWGDVIELADGVYDQPGDLAINLLRKSLTIRSASGNAESCILDGTDTYLFLFTPALNGDQFVGNFEGLTVRNATATGSTGSRIQNWDANFVNCRFLDNGAPWAGRGGAFYIVASDTTFTNCVFSGNQAANPGGIGGSLFASNLGSVSATNCVFTSGTAGAGSAIGTGLQGTVDLRNCIVWGDGLAPFSGTITATNSIIDSGWPGTGNLDADPLFFDPDGPDDDPLTFDDNDYRLTAGSPGIDAGDNALLPLDVFDLDGDGDTAEVLPLDLDRNSRVVAGTVDMGPYEVQAPPCVADFAAPFGVLNFFDVAAYIALYNSGDPAADLAAPIGTLNFFDISAFIAAYNAGCP